MSAKNAMEEKQGRRRRRSEPQDEPEDNELELEDEDRSSLTERKGRATPGRRAQSEDSGSGNFITRPLRGISNYFEDVRSEIAKVTWPTRQETLDLTWIVLATTIASSIVLGVISLVFTELFRFGLDTPIILIVIIVIAVAAMIYYLRVSNKRPSSY